MFAFEGGLSSRVISLLFIKTSRRVRRFLCPSCLSRDGELIDWIAKGTLFSWLHYWSKKNSLMVSYPNIWKEAFEGSTAHTCSRVKERGKSQKKKSGLASRLLVALTFPFSSGRLFRREVPPRSPLICQQMQRRHRRSSPCAPGTRGRAFFFSSLSPVNQ